MYIKFLLICLCLSLLSYLSFRNATLTKIEEIRINQKFYPKHYVKPNKAIKKIFRIRQKYIPIYFYIELFIVIFSAILFPLNSIIYFMFDNFQIVVMLIIFHICLMFFNTIYFLIICFIFRKKK